MICILVVDDDALVRRALFRQLTGAGYLVSVAASVRDVRYRMNPPPDAVICDFDLPDGTAMDVYGALNQPKRFIVHTGNADAYVPTDIPRFTKPDVAGVLEQLQTWFH
jgi:DNA-binding NtrC family response regulator